MSSTSAVSSGGPSSPNISDSLNSRSDFSISLASNDGGLLTSVTDYSQMFQMLDEDLGTVSTQFAFDHFRQHSEEKSTTAKSSSLARRREGNEQNSLEGLDDEEDEPTLSTDNYSVNTTQDNSNENSQKKIQPSPKNLSEKSSLVDQPSIPVVVDDGKNVENIEPNNCQQQTERLSRIQKQISLYERDNSLEYKKLSQDVEKFTRRPGSGHTAKRWVNSAPQRTNYVSADNILSNTSFYISRSPIKDSNCSNPKTMSCMNLKSCTVPPPTPGAVVVKEKYIEPPVRVAKSFHGNTSFLKYKKCKKSKKMDAGVSTDSVFTTQAPGSDIKHRFVTTKVNEFNIDSDKCSAADAEKCDQKK